MGQVVTLHKDLEYDLNKVFSCFNQFNYSSNIIIKAANLFENLMNTTNKTDREEEKRGLIKLCDEFDCTASLDLMISFLGDNGDCQMVDQLYNKSPWLDMSHKGFRDYYM